jgi:hypothetical protein
MVFNPRRRDQLLKGAPKAVQQNGGRAYEPIWPEDKACVASFPKKRDFFPPLNSEGGKVLDGCDARNTASAGDSAKDSSTDCHASWQSNLAVEDGHWRRYLGLQYREFRNIQFEFE